jgi:hypothetical protein
VRVRGNMDSVRRAIKVAKLVGQDLAVSVDVNDLIMVSVPYTCIMETPTSYKMSSIWGRGPTVEHAARDFISQLSGVLVCESPRSERKTVAVVAV